MGAIKHIEDLDQFKAMLSEAKGLVVVDFTASWCGPCRFIGPKFEELSKLAENEEVVFAKVDVDEAEDVAADQKIQAMPTFKFFKNGEQVAEMMGADLGTLTSLLAEHK